MTIPTERKPLEWAPHTIATVDTADGQATGFIGRAAAIRTGDGIEFVLLAKDEATLHRLISAGLVGNADQQPARGRGGARRRPA